MFRAWASVRSLAAGIPAGLLLVSPFYSMAAAEADRADSTNETPNSTAVESPRSFREEQDAIQQAIEQLRREVFQGAKNTSETPAGEPEQAPSQRDVDALVTRLGLIEQQLNLQHRRDLEAMQSSNRTLLIVAGILAGVGFLGILLAVLILMRTMNRLSEVALTYSVGQGLVASHAPPVLVPGDSPSAGSNPVEQVSARFLGAIERLEKRIGELEHSAQSVPVPPGNYYALASAKSFKVKSGAEGDETSGAPASMPPNQRSSGSADNPPPPATVESDGETASQVALMVGKGQALLNLGQAEDALVCLEKAIGLDPANAEALIKRGIALEKLQRTDEAIASYDRAIAANGETTLAYLHKGAIYNRQQRFREALECYEKALKTEQKPLGS